MFSLNSKVGRKILNLFFLNKDKSFYINEIARKIKEDPANVHKKLIQLTEEGLLVDFFQGKERFFSLNLKYPLLKEYRKIILKEVGFEKDLQIKLQKIAGIEQAYIFGSYVRQKMSLESDIDLLVIGNFNSLQLQKTILEIQKLINREINTVELTPQEFKKKKKQNDPFLEDIFSKEYLQIL